MIKTTNIKYTRTTPYTLRASRVITCTPAEGWRERYDVVLTVDNPQAGNPCHVSTLQEKTYKSEARAVSAYETIRREIWG